MTLTATASPAEVLWLIVATLGAAMTVLLLFDAVADLRAARESDQSAVRVLIAAARGQVEATRLVAQVALLVLAIRAVDSPPVPVRVVTPVTFPWLDSIGFMWFGPAIGWALLVGSIRSWMLKRQVRAMLGP